MIFHFFIASALVTLQSVSLVIINDVMPALPVERRLTAGIRIKRSLSIRGLGKGIQTDNQ
jgi:hypothetical protein